MDQNLNWKVQWAHAVKKGMKWAMQIRRIARPSWGITPKYARCLYTCIALLRILYVADIWCIMAHGERTEKRIMGLAKTTSLMVSIQRAGALAITGGLRTSPTDMLNVHVHLLPVSMLVNKWCHGALTRMAALPKEHPLYKIMKSRRLGKTKRHKGLLHHLMKWFKIDINTVEKTPTVVRNPSKAGELPFELSIAESKEDSIKEMEEALEEIQIFMDSSAMEGKVGAAVILIHEGRHTQTLRFHLGPKAEHTVHKAELVGILLRLHILSTKKENGKPASIGMDNQAAIKAFTVNHLRKVLV